MELEDSWKSACKIIFGAEIGNLEDYAGWLSSEIELKEGKSSESGKDIFFCTGEYCANSKRISYDEISKSQNEMAGLGKEFDSIESLLEGIYPVARYCGNITLGNCSFIKDSANISDCQHISKSSFLRKCRHLFSCSMCRESESCFGCTSCNNSSFCIKTNHFKNKRCLELRISRNCSDCYFSAGLENCSDCIFCFNLQSRHNCIGNHQLGKEEYEKIKAKLLGQIRAYLVEYKSLPSVFEIAGRAPANKPALEIRSQEFGDFGKIDKKIIEADFSLVLKLLFGVSPKESVDGYRGWLGGHVTLQEEHVSCFSSKPIRLIPYPAYRGIPPDRLLSFKEALEGASKLVLSEAEVQNLEFERAREIISRIAYFTPEWREDSNSNIIDCCMSTDSQNCYQSAPVMYTRNCAFTFWPKSCKSVYGCHIIYDSQACVNCYFSENLSRCFEMDSCKSCSDSYFCHNSENLQECMFCFNVKGKRYAIGNVELKKEDYLRIKKLVLDEIGEKLEREKRLGADIFNIGCTK
ncbi:MAG: hypothetical protein V1909_02885 [Candidatus Micrarchaeota archaeon]